MRRTLILTSVLFAACAASGAVMAQTTQTGATGLRYLSWPGKTPAPAPLRQSALRPTQVAAVANTTAAAIPLARLDAPAPTPAPRRGLTPASDWISPAATTPQAYFAPHETAAAPTPRPAPAPAPTPTHVEAPRRAPFMPRLQPPAPGPGPDPDSSPGPDPGPDPDADHG